MAEKIFKKTCVVCNQPLFKCPSGLVCKKGHGIGFQGGSWNMRLYDSADWAAMKREWERGVLRQPTGALKR